MLSRDAPPSSAETTAGASCSGEVFCAVGSESPREVRGEDFLRSSLEPERDVVLAALRSSVCDAERRFPEDCRPKDGRTRSSDCAGRIDDCLMKRGMLDWTLVVLLRRVPNRGPSDRSERHDRAGEGGEAAPDRARRVFNSCTSKRRVWISSSFERKSASRSSTFGGGSEGRELSISLTHTS